MKVRLFSAIFFGMELNRLNKVGGAKDDFIFFLRVSSQVTIMQSSFYIALAFSLDSLFLEINQHKMKVYKIILMIQWEWVYRVYKWIGSNSEFFIMLIIVALL